MVLLGMGGVGGISIKDMADTSSAIAEDDQPLAVKLYTEP
jgi:hypothetical protein